jgi:hypothetical protein
MKAKKTIHEVSNTINTDQLDVRKLQYFKIFSLPVWLAIVISISLGFVAKPVRSETTGTEDVKRNYRYIKPKGLENKAETTSQGAKASAPAKATEAKKTNQGKQAATSGAVETEKNANQAAKETSGAMGEAKQTPPGEQAKSPSTATAPLSTKETSADKCPGAEKTTSGAQNPPAGGNVGQEPKESSPATVKERGDQAASGNQTTNTGQTPQQMTPSATGTSAGNLTSGDQKPQIDRKVEPVSKAAEGEPAAPSFEQADKNADHYVTKDELKDYPSLLEVFDKVDAGKDGKLEQHEYQNLGMETKREGEIP